MQPTTVQRISVLGELVEIPDTNESANRGVETRRKKQSVLRDKISEEEDVSSEKLQTANLGESVSWGEEDRNDENLPPANSLETLNNNIIENTISVAGKIAGSSPSYDSKDNCKEKKNDSCCTVMRVSKNESGDRCFKMPALPVQKRRTRRAGTHMQLLYSHCNVSFVASAMHKTHSFSFFSKVRCLQKATLY